MQIIPVIDILDGEVVHGIQGKRSEYKPIKSKIVSSSNPLDVARVFREVYDLKDLYVADLNSIMGTGQNFDIISKISKELKMDIILDFGIRCEKDLDKEILDDISGIIIATETLKSLEVIPRAIKKKGIENVIVSIDIKNGELLKSINELENPEQAVRMFWEMEVRKFILLDLGKVGSMSGPGETIIKLIRNLGDLTPTIITGGGIRSIEDIKELERFNVSAVLIATALHQEKITKNDLKLI